MRVSSNEEKRASIEKDWRVGRAAQQSHGAPESPLPARLCIHSIFQPAPSPCSEQADILQLCHWDAFLFSPSTKQSPQAFICSLTHLQILLRCQRQPSLPKIISVRATTEAAKHVFSLLSKARHLFCEVYYMAQSFSCPQNGTTVSVTVSVCKQCQSAEIGPPMRFRSTKNTINGFWPNLPMM